jgi:hypothetical protein
MSSSACKSLPDVAARIIGLSGIGAVSVQGDYERSGNAHESPGYRTASSCAAKAAAVRSPLNPSRACGARVWLRLNALIASSNRRVSRLLEQEPVIMDDKSVFR